MPVYLAHFSGCNGIPVERRSNADYVDRLHTVKS